MTHLKQILKLRNPELLNKDFKKIFSKTIKKEHYINIQQYMALNKNKQKIEIEKENKN
tara:strand:- start:323 stop:496 length:174 start_codon:yes stop_codon:yes gene_type:complete